MPWWYHCILASGSSPPTASPSEVLGLLRARAIGGRVAPPLVHGLGRVSEHGAIWRSRVRDVRARPLVGRPGASRRRWRKFSFGQDRRAAGIAQCRMQDDLYLSDSGTDIARGRRRSARAEPASAASTFRERIRQRLLDETFTDELFGPSQIRRAEDGPHLGPRLDPIFPLVQSRSVYGRGDGDGSVEWDLNRWPSNQCSGDAGEAAAISSE